MRRLRFFPALLVILSACSENVIEKTQLPTDEMGTVAIALSTDLQNEVVRTKAESDEPVLDDFRVAIYKVDGQIRLYNDSYANSVGKEIPLNAGNYRIVAQHGDTLGCGFNKPYYLADKTFEVKAGENTVEAVAKLANVKLAVDFNETISLNYSDYYAVVKHNVHKKKSVKFTKNETRYGYIPAGELYLEIYADIDGTWKYYKTDVLSYNPNDFVTFDITTDARESSLVVNITVDNTVEDKTEVIEIPAIYVPQEAPVITLAGFDAAENTHEFVEGISEGTNAMASFVARGSIAKAELTIKSDYLAAMGVPEVVDFANLSSDDKTSLTTAGFSWDKEMNTSRDLSYIDFSGVIQRMARDTKSTSEDVLMGEFTLKVEDSTGKTSTSSFRIVSGSVKLSLAIEDYNIWAKKIVAPVVTINKGNSSLVRLQVSTDKVTWSEYSNPSLQGSTLTYGNIPVNPSTTYYVRAIYNNNENCATSVRQLTTESAVQLPNAGFESWTTLVHEFLYDFGLIENNHNINWYYPNEGWAVNSKKTLPSKTAVLSAYWDCIRFPMVAYTTDKYAGSYAAMVYSVSVGDGSTPGVEGLTNVVGQMWTGTMDGSGNATSTTIAFPSRPSSFTFAYKYKSCGGEKFYAVAELYNGSDVIATALINGDAASSWTTCTIPFTYTNLNKKATSISVRFKSTTANEPDIDANSSVVIANGESHTGNFGSVLYIDELNLTY